MKKVHFKFKPGGVNEERDRRLATEHPGTKFEPFGDADGGVVALDDSHGLELLLEDARDFLAALVHGKSERLHDEVVAVTIDDEAGDAVAFTPHEPPEARVAASALAVGDGLGDAALEEVEVEFLPLAGEAAGDDLRLGVVNRRAEQPIFAVFYRDDVAVFGFSPDFEDFAGIDPVVSVVDA